MSRYQVQLKFSDQTLAIEVDPGETILEAAHRQRVFLAADCTLGVCGTCRALRTEGESDTEGLDSQGLNALQVSKGFILTCLSHPRSDLSLEFGYDSARAIRPEQRAVEAILIECSTVAESVVRLLLRTTGGERIDYQPGQYANISIPGTSEHRSFSFSNTPAAGSDLEFFIRILPDGLMSNYLRDSARPGHRLRLTGPFGEFYLREPGQPILMVAGGTGLAPMLSMLGALAASGEEPPPIRLLYGVNQSAEIFGIERLDEYRRDLDNFTYELAVALPEPDWTGASGFVTELLSRELLPPDGLDAYLCGPPPMIEAVTEWLSDHRLPVENIHSEKFSASQ